jgi:hypothetical protein
MSSDRIEWPSGEKRLDIVGACSSCAGNRDFRRNLRRAARFLHLQQAFRISKITSLSQAATRLMVKAKLAPHFQAKANS